MQNENPSFPSHFDGERFFNPGGPQPHGFGQLLRWMATRKRRPVPKFIADVVPSVPPRQVEDGKLRVTFVNHSTVLLQMQGCNILTDPIWSERTSPFSWIGPRRHRAPGVKKEDVPPMDAVLISHNHYDHLDIPTLRWLGRRGKCVFVVPAGERPLLASHDVGPAHELDWGESFRLGDVTIHSVPAVHFSARGILDRNRSLWCGYVIECRGRTIYYAGDTAFGDHFQKIRERFGSPQLALLPIGAYEPRWFMSVVHMDPAEAVRAHRILGAKNSIGVHYGTFQLADDGLDEPLEELKQIVERESFVGLRNGEFLEVV